VLLDNIHGNAPLERALQHYLGEHAQDLQELCSSILAPLVARERVIGYLNLAHHEPGYYSEHQAKLVLAIANQAAGAIENARLYGRAQAIAAMEERQRLARELHDSVSQALYGIGLGTYAAKNLLERGQPGVPEALDYVTSLASAGLAEMRALIFELHPESLEIEGLVVALSKQAEALRARHRIEVETEFPAEPEIPLETKEVLYRVAQEALHNTVKHANARQVHVRLTRVNGDLLLNLRDDGQGFDPHGSFPGHLGLRSMRERVSQLGGAFEIESAPGKGTTIHVRIPYVNRV
jgi:signal transduction histidine kinase